MRHSNALRFESAEVAVFRELFDAAVAAEKDRILEERKGTKANAFHANDHANESGSNAWVPRESIPCHPDESALRKHFEELTDRYKRALVAERLASREQEGLDRMREREARDRIASARCRAVADLARGRGSPGGASMCFNTVAVGKNKVQHMKRGIRHVIGQATHQGDVLTF